MNLHLHFILVNSEFNKGLADDLYNGEESEDNIKHLWEDEFLVSEPVKEFKISNNAIYKLAGFFPDDKPFSFEVWDMTIEHFHRETHPTQRGQIQGLILRFRGPGIREAVQA